LELQWHATMMLDWNACVMHMLRSVVGNAHLIA
jgi:hypothetical protein